MQIPKSTTGVINNSKLNPAGTKSENGTLLTNGGRVLNIVGEGSTLQEAIGNSYAQVQKISFEKSFYRRDIGAKGLKRLA
jgi:phosphoribosylamine-glycine ligase